MIDKHTTLLVFSPHPDDEVLGCAGLMRRVKEAGGHVHIKLFSLPEHQGDVRKSEFETAMNLLEVDSHEVFFPATYHLKLDLMPQYELVQKIEAALDDIRPTLCAIPFPSFNQDHAYIYQACISALRSSHKGFEKMEACVLVYEYPQMGWGGGAFTFTPNVYINITDQLESKLRAFECYGSQNKNQQYAISRKSVEILAQFRGREVTAQAAEAYEMKRMFIR